MQDGLVDQEHIPPVLPSRARSAYEKAGCQVYFGR